MPIRPPSLDDRTFDDLVAEILARVPAHTPEWVPRPGDPGRTLIELFAWMTDALLYRANLIPERQRLAFLRLLGEPMRGSAAARGIVSVFLDDEEKTDAVTLAPYASLEGPAKFETRTELTVLPVTAEVFYKRPLTEAEREDLAEVLEGLQRLYQLRQAAVPYATTPVFANGRAMPRGLDIGRDAVDKSLWLAILASKPEFVDEVRLTLGGAGEGRQILMNVAVAPTIEVPPLFEEIGPRAEIPHVWEISTGREVDVRRGQEVLREPEYLTLEQFADSTAGLTRSGVVRLILPGHSADHQTIGAPENDPRREVDAGVGDRPPRLDDPEMASRLVTWLRLRPTVFLESMSLSWVGVNAVEIDQRQSFGGVVVGAGDGTAGQEIQLPGDPGQSVELETFELQVEEEDRRYREWQRVDDLASAGRNATVYTLDPEARTVCFGDRVRGRAVEAGRRVRVARMRVGGGSLGNLPPGSLTEISDARDLRDVPVPDKLNVVQALPTRWGLDGETLEEAEARIPALLRHRNRAVTEEDFRRLATDTPGTRVGRVEVLPRFKPQQRQLNVPGVVSVMVLPFKEERRSPNPRADRFLLEAVHFYLDGRRPLATELYVIGCEYVPLGATVGLRVRNGFARDVVVQGVRDALRDFLWSLAPGGPEGDGWPLGRTVCDRELEVIVARVPGVNRVNGINLFERHGESWRMVEPSGEKGLAELDLQFWQLPELLTVVVAADDDDPPEDLRGVPDPFADQAGAPGMPGEPGKGGGIAVPVVPEVC